MPEEKITGCETGWKVKEFARRCLNSEQFVEEAGNANNVGNRGNQKVFPVTVNH